MTLDLNTGLILVTVGVVAGILNTIAGGGSFLTLPALIWTGLPATVANGTNRVAVLLQSAVGARAMYRRIRFDVRATLRLALPTMIGAIAGAAVATQIDPAAMRLVIGVALLGGALLVGVRPHKILIRSRTESQRDPTIAAVPNDRRSDRDPLAIAAFFGIGFYGGFLQAGVGALLLLGLAVVARWDLLEATGAKNLIVTCFTVPALAVFALAGDVAWLAGATLAVGNVIGAEIGARLAVRGGHTLIAAAVVVMLLVAGVRLLLG